MKFISTILLGITSAILFSVIPIPVQSFPINGLLVAHSMTFATLTVTIVQNAAGKGAGAYSPDTITIHSGDTVIWHNVDSSAMHTATCGSGSPCGQWGTASLGTNGFSSHIPYTSFSVGTTGYYCAVHGYPSMYGGVIRVSVDVQQWEKMSSSEREKELEYHPLQSTFGLIFVSPDVHPSVQTMASNAGKQKISNVSLNGSLAIQAGVPH